MGTEKFMLGRKYAEQENGALAGMAEMPEVPEGCEGPEPSFERGYESYLAGPPKFPFANG